MTTITVALTDIPAFTARFGLRLKRTGKLDAMYLPEVEWVSAEGQTDEQRAAVEKLKSGIWRPKE